MTKESLHSAEAGSLKMTWSEMVANVERLLTADGSETELDRLLDQLIEALPGGGILDLIYYPDKDRTAEDIVCEAILQQNRTKA